MGRKGARNTRYKTKKRTRDIDQICDDVKVENITRRIKEATEVNEDLPGLGQYFCLECDKYFVNQQTLDVHKIGKPHKRRVKSLEEEPYTQEEADRAAGLIRDESHIPSKRRCLQTTSSDVAQLVPTDQTASKPAYVYAS